MWRLAKGRTERTDEMRLGHIGDLSEAGDIEWFEKVTVHRVAGTQHSAVGLLDISAHRRNLLFNSTYDGSDFEGRQVAPANRMNTSEVFKSGKAPQSLAISRHRYSSPTACRASVGWQITCSSTSDHHGSTCDHRRNTRANAPICPITSKKDRCSAGTFRPRSPSPGPVQQPATAPSGLALNLSRCIRTRNRFRRPTTSSRSAGSVSSSHTWFVLYLLFGFGRSALTTDRGLSGVAARSGHRGPRASACYRAGLGRADARLLRHPSESEGHREEQESRSWSLLPLIASRSLQCPACWQIAFKGYQTTLLRRFTHRLKTSPCCGDPIASRGR